MKNCHFTEHAFTLIELLLVILILVIIAGLTVPNFSSTYKRLLLRQTVNDLAYHMRYAQSRAVSKNATLRLMFDDQNRHYKLTEKLAGKQNFDDISGRWGRSIGIGQQVQLLTDQKAIHFYEDGSIDHSDMLVCPSKRKQVENFNQCLVVTTKFQRGHVKIIQPNDE